MIFRTCRPCPTFDELVDDVERKWKVASVVKMRNIKMFITIVIMIIMAFSVGFGKTYYVKSTDEIEKAILSDIMSFEPTTVLVARGTNNSTMLKVVDSVIKSLGEGLFLRQWAENSVEQAGVVTTTITYTYLETVQERKAVNDFIQKNIASIISGAKTEVEKVYMINEWIKLNIEYDKTYSYRSVYATLRNQRGVCQGYALLFYKLAKAAGLQVYLVSGQGKDPTASTRELEPHAWNVVKIGNDYYYVDVTWNDGTGTNVYLLFGTDLAKYSHYPDTKLPGTISAKSYASKLYDEIVKGKSLAASDIFDKLYGPFVLNYDNLVNYLYYGIKNKKEVTFVADGNFVVNNLADAIGDAMGYANVYNVSYTYAYTYFFTAADKKEFYVWKVRLNGK
ncbi:transglutaminase domain-containing protein [Fervidobacterium sp.]